MGMREPDELSMGMRTRPALYTPRPGAAPATMVPDMAYRPKPGTTPAGAVNLSAPLDLQGVEKRAADALMMQQNQGPMPPMIVNGALQFKAPTPPPATVLNAAASPSTTPPATAAASPSAPAMPNVLSYLKPTGAPASGGNSLSRGAAPRGLGGVAPVPVGRSGRDPMRLAERAARGGNLNPLMYLTSEQNRRNDAQRRDAEGWNQDMIKIGLGQEADNARYQRQKADQLDAEGRDVLREKDRFTMQQGAEDARYQRDQERRRADEAGKSVVGLEMLPAPDGSGFVPTVRRQSGERDLAGGFYPTKKETPDVLSFLPLPGTRDAMPMLGDKPLPGAGLYEARDGLSPLPDGIAGPPKPVLEYVQKTPVAKTAGLSFTPGSPSMIEGGKPTPMIQRDPRTGEMWKLNEENSQWEPLAPPIPSRAQAAPAASATDAAPDPKARMNALRKRIGLPEL